MNEILNRIRSIFIENIEKGKTQTDIANIIDKTPQYVWKILNNNDVNPSKRLIKDVCDGFGINEEWILTGEGNKEKEIDSDYEEIIALIGETDPKAKQAIKDYWNLSPEDKELFWNFIDRFMKKEG